MDKVAEYANSAFVDVSRRFSNCSIPYVMPSLEIYTVSASAVGQARA